MNTTENNKICDCFKELIRIGAVSFYRSEEIEKLLMPIIPNSLYRYNNCPCCNKEVRGIELTQREFLDIHQLVQRN